MNKKSCQIWPVKILSIPSRVGRKKNNAPQSIFQAPSPLDIKWSTPNLFTLQFQNLELLLLSKFTRLKKNNVMIYLDNCCYVSGNFSIIWVLCLCDNDKSVHVNLNLLPINGTIFQDYFSKSSDSLLCVFIRCYLIRSVQHDICYSNARYFACSYQHIHRFGTR